MIGDPLVWEPTKKVAKALNFREEFGRHDFHKNRDKAFRLLRSSSSGYASRKEVREYIFKRDGCKCLNCGTNENLSLDHIVSVSKCFYQKEIEMNRLNTLENLQTLCKQCNSIKSDKSTITHGT